MKEKIFSTSLTHKFYDKSIEKEYMIKTSKSLFKVTKWFTLSLFIASLTTSILIFTGKNSKAYKQSHPNQEVELANWLIYLITGLFFAFTCLSFIFSKNYWIQKFCSYFNFYALFYTFMYISIYMFIVSPQEPLTLVYLMLFIEFLLRMFIIFLFCVDFSESGLLSLFIIFSVWIINYAFGMIPVSFSVLIFHNIQIVFICFYAYFYTKEARKSFYFYYKEREKKLWYESVIENMNSGFILIKNEKIEFMNKSMMDLFFKDYSFITKISQEKEFRENGNPKEPVNIKSELNINLKISNDNPIYNKINKINEDLKIEETIKLNKYLINEKNYSIRDQKGKIDGIDILESIALGSKFNKDDSHNDHYMNSCSFRNEKEFIRNHSIEILNEFFKDIENSDFIDSMIKEQKNSSFSNVNGKLIHKHFFEIIKHEKNFRNRFVYIGTKGVKKPLENNRGLNENLTENEHLLHVGANENYFKGEENERKKTNDKLDRNPENLSDNDEENLLFFEISMRYYKTDEDDNYEIILNDISRTKLKEKKNAEFKYKTIFLSKVAHEFKNPLICIIELIDQINDSKELFDCNKEIKANINNLLSQIKGISNYLLILVKDLDYFSVTQNQIKYQLEYEKCNLEEILNFINQIGTILLKRAGKLDKVNFLIEKDPILNNFISTDEIKLKQILVNLLSNSIKFTNFGEIKLFVGNNLNNEKDIDFILTDTGVGMINQKQQFSLFKKKMEKNNYLGSGLGFFIINELSSQIGTQVHISSELGKGS